MFKKGYWAKIRNVGFQRDFDLGNINLQGTLQWKWYFTYAKITFENFKEILA